MRLHCGRTAGLEVAEPFEILDLNGDRPPGCDGVGIRWRTSEQNASNHDVKVCH